jgi:endonuclease/exonuclease/phosphatase family metal-dependent hydrolase
MVSLFLSILSSYISAEVLGVFSLLGIFYPFLYCVYTFFLFWTRKKKPQDRSGIMLKTHKKNIVLNLPVFWLIATFFFLRHFSIFPANTDSQLKVMTLNANVFGIYDLKSKTKAPEIVNFIVKEAVDIVCFQEFFLNYNHQEIVQMMEAKGFNYFKYKDLNYINGHVFGLAIFSKYPLDSFSYINPNESKNNYCLKARVNIENKFIWIYNAHMQSIQIPKEEADILTAVENSNWNFKTYSYSVLRRVLLAYPKRQRLVDAILQDLSDDQPSILCCDLNDVPISYSYQLLIKKLNNHGIYQGFGLKYTYVFNFLPLNIDYILYRGDQLKSKGLKTFHQIGLSDHVPSIAYFDLKE